MELDIKKVNEDIVVVRCDYNKTEHEVVAESFHDSDVYFAANRCAAVDDLENNGDVLGDDSGGTESSQVDGVGRVLN